jgi:hypothetical protein
MHLLAVTFIANRCGMAKGKDRADFMSNMSVTVSTFDLMVCDVILVHELGGNLGIQSFGFLVALEAFPLRNMTVPLNNIDMALLARDAPCNVLSVIESPPLDFNVPFRFDVA